MAGIYSESFLPELGLKGQALPKIPTWKDKCASSF